MGICILNSCSETSFKNDSDSPALLLCMDGPRCTYSPHTPDHAITTCIQISLLASMLKCWLRGMDGSLVKKTAFAQCSLLPPQQTLKQHRACSKGQEKDGGEEFTAHPCQGKGGLSLACGYKGPNGGSLLGDRKEEVHLSVPLSGDCSMVRVWVSRFR